MTVNLRQTELEIEIVTEKEIEETDKEIKDNLTAQENVRDEEIVSQCETEKKLRVRDG